MVALRFELWRHASLNEELGHELAKRLRAAGTGPASVAALKAETAMVGGTPVERLDAMETEAVYAVVTAWLDGLVESAQPEELVKFKRDLKLAMQ